MSKKDKSTNRFLTDQLYKVFQKHPNKSFNYKQLIKQLALHDDEKSSTTEIQLSTDLRTELQQLLDTLVRKGELIEIEIGKYKLKPKHAYLEGVIDFTTNGAAYLVSENEEEDVYIAPRNVKNALHGDRVRIYLYARHKGQKLEGSVVEVIKRAKTEFVGKIQMTGNYAFVITDSQKMMVDIFIPENNINGAKHGQKVMASIADWPEGAKNPIGKVVKVLGWPGENETEMNSILAEYGFPLEFPEAVEKDAAAIPFEIDQHEIKRRRDLRDVVTFTIDPVDAKDFDDALSIRRLKNGHWEIGVHIADVSHYVRPGSALDREAYERGTSIYLVDRVIPMLPEKLSNGVCSLRPKEDKLCFSAVFEIDEEAHVLNHWFGKTVIHSDHRFAYEDAQKVLETGEGTFSMELLTLNDLAKKLRAERFRKGAIAFEKLEVKFLLDEKGKPLGVYLKEAKDSNKLIEEFMLLANRSVAESIGKTHFMDGMKTQKQGQKEVTKVAVRERPFVYRIHDSPVADRLQNFAQFASRWGYKVETTNDKKIAQSLNGLMKSLHGKKEQNVLEQLAIRTMSKAIYTTDNIGHYGLAFDYYTHFTSPIRRYPDVLVHRLLEHYQKSRDSADKELLEAQCKHSTMMEIRASEAERASIKYKQVEFLKDKVGEIFNGLISGVTEWGLYVEIVENKCEGMIRLRDLDDDFYEFDETNYRVVGSRTGRIYSMGDEVKVQVMRCDLLKKQIDLRMISDLTAVKKPSSQRHVTSYQKPFQGKKQAASRKHGQGTRKKKRR